jgi:diaminopimelate epimerase
MPDFPIPFVKMSGTGNDFIVIDNRAGLVKPEEMPLFAAGVCHRQNSVGADGLILIEEDPELDFAWRFFNADGTEPAMCGNGSRCAARFAFLEGIAREKMVFRTGAGAIAAEVKGARVRVALTPAHGLMARFSLPIDGREWDAGFIDTGVPHAVILVPAGPELDRLAVDELGRKVRFHPRFGAAGANANFAAVADRHTLHLRTYERGVEGETLACGTGAVASALVCAARGLVESPVSVVTRGGETLKVHFDAGNPEGPAGGAVHLEGAARLICRGHLMEEGVPR